MTTATEATPVDPQTEDAIQLEADYQAGAAREAAFRARTAATTAPVAVDARQVTTTARGRTYEWQGETFWSVTTLIKKGLPSPAIAEWTAQEIAKFAVGNHRQLSGMLSTVRMEHIDKRLDPTIADRIRDLFGLRARVLGPRGGEKEPGGGIYIVREDPDAIAGAISWLRNAPYRDSNRKADIGTAVHAELEAYALDRPRPEPPLIVRPYVIQFRLFLEAFKPEIVLAEANCYNRTEAYAGRLDAVMKIGSLSWLVDYTTGKAVYADKAYQCSAYRRAEFVGLRDGTERPMPATDGAFVLRLGEDTFEVVPVMSDEAVFRDFRLIRESFDIIERRSKRIVGTPVTSPEALNFLAVGEGPSLELVPPAVPVVVELAPEPEE